MTSQWKFVIFLAAAAMLLILPLGCDCGCDDDDDSGSSHPDDDIDDDDDITDDDLDDDDDTAGEPPVTTADPEGGLFGDAVTVTLTSVDDTTDSPTIYYTTNGDEPVVGAPTTQSGLSPLILLPFTETTTLKFFAVDEDDLQEETQEELYEVDTEAPETTADEPGGFYNVAVDVTLTSVDDYDPAPTVYYRTDGGEPGVDDPDTLVGTSPVDLGTFTVNTTLKYFAVDAFDHVEETKTDTYVFDLEAPNTVADPVGGWFDTTISVTLTSTDNDDPVPTIYYTTDGSVPTIGGPTTISGDSPVTISDLSTDTPLRFFAVDDSSNEEFLKEEDYLFDFLPPVCDSTPPTGAYNGPYPPLSIQPLNVTLDCPDDRDDTPDTTVYFTVNGTQPVIGGPDTYSATSPASIEVPLTTDVRFFAVDHLGHVSAEVLRHYDIYFWDDFESWLTGFTPGYPWWITTDPWNCTLPTVQTITTAPGGKVLRMVDINASCQEGDSYASLWFDSQTNWPDHVGFQFDARLRGGTVGGFGSFYTDGGSRPWRVIVYFRNGGIDAWDQSLNAGAGGWFTCMTPTTYNQWYAINVVSDLQAKEYDVEIDGAATACSGLELYYDGVGVQEKMTGVRFVTEGPSDGTIEFNNFRVYDTLLP